MVELMLYLALSMIVLGVMTPIFVANMRSYQDQREIVDAREIARGAVTLLTWELRQLSASDGDLYAISPNSLVLRSTQGQATVCARHPTLPRYGLVETSGSIGAADSAIVFAAAGGGPADDAWLAIDVQATSVPASGNVPWCFWGDSASVAPQTVVTVSADTSDVRIGAPIRTFQKFEYGVYTMDGRKWLGRRQGASTWQQVAGPLVDIAPLEFEYFDSSGAVTTDPTLVDLVKITVRAESFGKSRRVGQTPLEHRVDTVTTRIRLRG